MAHVADVQRSIDFYKLLGFEVVDTYRNDQGTLCWTFLQSGRGSIMLTLAGEPVVPEQQAILFYVYTDDLVALREYVLTQGLKAPEITYPFYMPKGELRLNDPDGYCLLVGQMG
jgi:hypothetical protein